MQAAKLHWQHNCSSKARLLCYIRPLHESPWSCTHVKVCAQAFTAAIKAARGVFDMGAFLGFRMRLLDLGGGFVSHPGADGLPSLGGVPAAVNAALDAHFPKGLGVSIIAEPGRCAACPARLSLLHAACACVAAASKCLVCWAIRNVRPAMRMSGIRDSAEASAPALCMNLRLLYEQVSCKNCWPSG